MPFKKSGVRIIFSVLLTGILFLYTAGTSMAKEQKWLVELSYLFLVEHVDGEDLFWIDDNGDDTYDSSEKKYNTDKLLSTWDDPNANIGWRGEIGYSCSSGWGLSVVYLGRIADGEYEIKDNNDNINPRFDDDPDIANTGNLPDFSGADEVHMDLETKFHSVEVNVLFPPWQLNECTQLRALAGPRFIWIKDNMAMEGYDDLPDLDDRSDLNIDTENFLGGLQTGLGLHWQPCSWFGLFTDLNAGVYYADIDQKVRFKEFDNANDKWESKDSDNSFGFLCEARIAGEFRLTKNIGLRLGYMVLYLSETGRAINQVQPGEGLDEDESETEFPGLNKDYTFYHGVMASAIIRW